MPVAGPDRSMFWTTLPQPGRNFAGIYPDRPGDTQRGQYTPGYQFINVGRRHLKEVRQFLYLENSLPAFNILQDAHGSESPPHL